MAVPRRGVAKRIQSATTFRDFGASSLVPAKGSLNPSTLLACVQPHRPSKKMACGEEPRIRERREKEGPFHRHICAGWWVSTI